MRVTDAGEVFVIEVNPNCYLEAKSEFARAAERDGIAYDALIAQIVELASARTLGSKDKEAGHSAGFSVLTAYKLLLLGGFLLARPSSSRLSSRLSFSWPWYDLQYWSGTPVRSPGGSAGERP